KRPFVIRNAQACIVSLDLHARDWHSFQPSSRTNPRRDALFQQILPVVVTCAVEVIAHHIPIPHAKDEPDILEFEQIIIEPLPRIVSASLSHSNVEKRARWVAETRRFVLANHP